jgi:hypothetical protein
MPKMTALEIKTYVRDHLDVDSLDIPDSLLNVWMRDAVIRIISFFDESPVWLQVERTFTTVPNQQSYDLEATVGLGDIVAPGILLPLQAIDEVRGPNFSLSPRSHRQVRESYRADAPSGRPQEFSQWGTQLYLWPKPADAEVYSVLGIRRPDWDWITSTAGVPDLPEEFHPLVAQWALSRGYAQQDDPDMANLYRGEFGAELSNIASRWMGDVTALPMVMNGGRRNELYRTQRILGPLTYGWE